MNQSSQGSANDGADISVITFTLGTRDKYLFNCLDSVYNDGFLGKVEHHVIFQGSVPDEGVRGCLSTYKQTPSYELIIHEWPQNIGIGAGLNKILSECTGDLILKLDDDAKIISEDFFDNALSIHKKFPNSCFNPYPIGLIGNPGGPRAIDHSVWYDKQNDKVWTRRHVPHLGGFSRFTPAHIIKSFKFSSDLIPGISGTEDGDFSRHCLANNIEMFYLESGLAVEHNESTLGQVVRYQEYFKNRSYESTVGIKVIE